MQSYFCLFRSKRFTVFTLPFTSLIYFNFCIWCEIEIQFYSFVSRYPIVFAPFVEKTFIPLNDPSSTVKNQLNINVWAYFWTLNSRPLIYMSIFIPASHSLYYCNFVVHFKIENCDGSILFFFKIVLALLSLLHFLYFRTSCKFLQKRQLKFY